MCFATVLNPTATELKELIAYSSVPVIVEMNARWYPPCQLLHPFLRKLAIDLGADAHVASIDVDANRELRVDWDVRALPHILIFRHGIIVERIESFETYASLRAAITRAMNIDAPKMTPEEAIFTVAIDWADAVYKAAARPADTTFRRLWAESAPERDRFAAAQRAAAERGEITVAEAASRIRADQDRHMAPLQAHLRASSSEAAALRQEFVDAVEDAVEIYAAAALCRISPARRSDRPSA